MTASPVRLSIADPPPLTTSAAQSLFIRLASVASFALGFFSFMPYPAVPIGVNSAIQIGNVITAIVILPVLAMSWRHRPFYMYPLLLLPRALCAIKVAIAQPGDLELCLKSTVPSIVSLDTIIAAQLFAPQFGIQMLCGVALATIIHTLVGLAQMYAFHFGGDLPLQWFYVNPSFLAIDGRTIVRYIQRPFGLFPEPSAMSSSEAPWVILWIAFLCGIIRFRQPVSRGQRLLFAAAAVCGLTLIILSRSGHAMVTVAAIVICGFLWLRRARADLKSYLLILLVFGVVVPLTIWMTMSSLQERVMGPGVGNSSWTERSESIVLGFSLWAHNGLASLIFGLGSGISAPMLREAARVEAVFSVLLTYVYETGIIGIIVVLWIGGHVLRLWEQTRFDVIYLLFLMVWVVGITLTTSYNQLLPIWLAMGWFTVWPSVIDTPGPISSMRVLRSAAPMPR